MRKIRRELRRAFPSATIKVAGRNHYRITLPSGAVVIVSGTPRNPENALRLARADARRRSRQAQITEESI